MHKIIIHVLCATLLLTYGCKKEEIIVHNTQITPDLSNPVIQKLTNITWYRDGMGTVQEEWTTLLNIPKPSEAMASMLYSLAWINITLHRDGTSTMLYLPPIFPHVYMHCKGTWTVSKDEENTVVINTKTPVSSAIIKAKVINMETAGNVGTLQLSMDFGNRLLNVFLANTNADTRLETFDEGWYNSNPVKEDAIQVSDFMGAWVSPEYDREKFNRANYPAENIVRSTNVYDLFSQTPNVFSGIKYVFQENGKALIGYGKNFFENANLGKEVVSEGRWSIKGNKIILETDEDLFYSAGEVLFGFPTHASNVTSYGIIKSFPVKTQAKRFYVFEVIKKENHGIWCRITSNDFNASLFLFKADARLENIINIKNIL